MRALTVALAATLFAPLAQAAVDSLSFASVYQPIPDDPQFDLSNSFSIDLLIDFTGELRGQQLFVELTAGELLYHPFGIGSPPNELFFDAAPGLPYDTFVGMGGPTLQTSSPILQLGGAVNVPGAPASYTVDPTVLSVAWAPAPGVAISDQNDYFVGRLTFSDDAQGQLFYFGSTFGDGGGFLSQSVISGDPVPEGDFNADGRVDNDDLKLPLSNWGADIPGAQYVHNWTSPIDNDELNRLLSTWGEGVGTLVPEPAGAALILILTAHCFSNTRSGVR